MLSDTTKRRKKIKIEVDNIELAKETIKKFCLLNGFNQEKGSKDDLFLISMKKFKPLEQSYAYWAFKYEIEKNEIIIEVWMGGLGAEEYPNQKYTELLNKLEEKILKTCTDKKINKDFLDDFNEEDFDNKESYKGCYLGFIFLLVQSILYFTGFSTNNLDIDLKSGDGIARFIGINWALIVSIIFFVKNKKNIIKSLKKVGILILIFLTIIISIFAYNEYDNLKNADYINNIDSITLEDVEMQKEETNLQNNYPYLYMIIITITDYKTYKTYKNDIESIQGKYTHLSAAYNEVFNYINSLPLDKYQKTMLSRIAGGYDISSSKNEMFDYINNLNLSATDKQGMYNELFN